MSCLLESCLILLIELVNIELTKKAEYLWEFEIYLLEKD